MNIRDLKNRLRHLDIDVRNELYKYAKDAGPLLTDSVQDTIMSTPSSINPRKDNRKFSGEMYNNVQFRVLRRGKAIVVDHGWWKAKHYFGIQEYGGTATDLYVGRRNITPMGSLEKATDLFLREIDLQDIVDDAVRKYL